MSRIFVDVREPEEFASSHAKGAVNIPLSTVMQGHADFSRLSKDDEIVVYCNSGNRSGVAKQVLEHQGFKNVVNGINQERVSAEYN